MIVAGAFFAFAAKLQFAERTLPVVVINKNTGAKNFGNTLTGSESSMAAAKNLTLRQNLVWAFGGKSQRGWYLYQPLISRAIGAESRTDETNFVEALSRWQNSVGLPPNGVLDEANLAVFVTKWQSNRLKKRGEASPDELQTVSTDDFYDVSRTDELRKVEHETYAAYKKMIAAAIADKSLNLANNGRGELAPDEKFLKIISAFRSPDYQAKLRQQSPNSGRAGLAVNSPHFTGHALDIYVGGEPVSTQDANRLIQINTPVYQWLVKNADKFGFKPYFYEPWHWEYAPDSEDK